MEKSGPSVDAGERGSDAGERGSKRGRNEDEEASEAEKSRKLMEEMKKDLKELRKKAKDLEKKTKDQEKDHAKTKKAFAAALAESEKAHAATIAETQRTSADHAQRLVDIQEEMLSLKREVESGQNLHAWTESEFTCSICQSPPTEWHDTEMKVYRCPHCLSHNCLPCVVNMRSQFLDPFRPKGSNTCPSCRGPEYFPLEGKLKSDRTSTTVLGRIIRKPCSFGSCSAEQCSENFTSGESDERKAHEKECSSRAGKECPYPLCEQPHDQQCTAQQALEHRALCPGRFFTRDNQCANNNVCHGLVDQRNALVQNPQKFCNLCPEQHVDCPLCSESVIRKMLLSCLLYTSPSPRD